MDRLTRINTPQPPEVANDVIVRNAKDEQGRRASFRVLLFTDEFRWRMSSYESLESRLEEPSFTPEMKAVLDKAREIIVVGASSEEIVPGLWLDARRKREEARAGKRAERIAMWAICGRLRDEHAPATLSAPQRRAPQRASGRVDPASHNPTHLYG